MLTDDLEILFEDDALVAINKPSGLLVHRSDLDRQAQTFALQLTRDKVGCTIFPVHRLDRPTSGVLLFAKSSAGAKALSQAFAEHSVQKGYLAVVRGYPAPQGEIDYALKFLCDTHRDRRAAKAGTRQNAYTQYQRLATKELPVAIEKYPQSRYALLACFPSTGRRHQIRRHLKHIQHPIIGDARYGRGRHNRFFADHLNAGRLLLHAHSLRFTHPENQESILVKAPLDTTMQHLFMNFDWPLTDWPTQHSPPAHATT